MNRFVAAAASGTAAEQDNQVEILNGTAAVNAYGIFLTVKAGHWSELREGWISFGSCDLPIKHQSEDLQNGPLPSSARLRRMPLSRKNGRAIPILREWHGTFAFWRNENEQ